MAVYSGEGGAVKIGANVVAEVESFELEVSRDIASFVELRGSGYRTKKPTIGDWKGTLTARWYLGDTNGQLALQSALMDGTSIALSLEIDDPVVGTYAGTAYVGNLKIGNPGDGIVTADVSFEGSGAPTFTAA